MFLFIAAKLTLSKVSIDLACAVIAAVAAKAEGIVELILKSLTIDSLPWILNSYYSLGSN